MEEVTRASSYGRATLRRAGMPTHAAEVSRPVWIAVFAAAAVASCLPLLLASHVPLIDYPFHIARISILERLPADAFLQEIYASNFRLIPNIAMDLVALGLSRFMPVEVAGRLFLGFSFVLTLGGLAALHRVLHGSRSVWPVIFGALLVHNWIFTFGFINYLFGLALLPWAIAAWIALTHEPAWSKIAIGSVAALVLFFSHLVAFVLFAVVLGGLGLHDALDGRRINFARLARNAGLSLAVCALPAFIYVFLSPTSADARTEVGYQSFAGKLESVILTPTSSSPVADLVALGGLVVFALIALRPGRVALAEPMRAVLVLFVLVFLFAPVSTGAGYHLDDRLPLAVLLLGAAAFRFRLPSTVVARVAVAVVCLAFIGRQVLISIDWMDWDEQFEEARRALDGVGPGSVLFAASAGEDLLPGGWRAHYALLRPPKRHLAAYGAFPPGVFAPVVFAHPQLQTITVQERFAPVSALQGFDPIGVHDAAALDTLEAEIARVTGDHALPFEQVHLVLLGSPRKRSAVLGKRIPWARSPNFDIVRLR